MPSRDDRPLQGALSVVVDRLQDRLTEGEELEMLLHDLDVVALRVERREREALALGAVVAVVVVDADRGDPLRTERSAEALGQGRLARGTVARNGEHGRADPARARVAPRSADGHLLIRHVPAS
jgi:hypothetical protein